MSGNDYTHYLLTVSGLVHSGRVAVLVALPTECCKQIILSLKPSDYNLLDEPL